MLIVHMLATAGLLSVEALSGAFDALHTGCAGGGAAEHAGHSAA